MTAPMAVNIGPTEALLVLLVLVLLFGAKKLPELARGSGRALRIFKAETKGLGEEPDAPTQDVPDGHSSMRLLPQDLRAE